MSYNIVLTYKFQKEAKRLVKKYPSLKSDLQELNDDLLKNPKSGTSLGYNAYKIRVAVKSKGKGKSGGARVITYLITEQNEIYLLTIYDKSELENISNKLLQQLIKEIKAAKRGNKVF